MFPQVSVDDKVYLEGREAKELADVVSDDPHGVVGHVEENELVDRRQVHRHVHQLRWGGMVSRIRFTNY